MLLAPELAHMEADDLVDAKHGELIRPSAETSFAERRHCSWMVRVKAAPAVDYEDDI